MRMSVLPLVMLVACGGNSGDVTVGNVQPVGTVGGIVIDGATRVPLQDADVRLFTGGLTPATTKTNMNGEFSFLKVPAGPILVTIEKAEYASAQVRDNLLENAGNFPLANAGAVIGPIGLLKTSGTFSVHVVDDHGEPLMGVVITARSSVGFLDFSLKGVPGASGVLITRTAPSDATGTTKVTGMPDLTAIGSSFLGASGQIDQVILEVPAVDANMDGVTDFTAQSKVFNLLSLPSTPTIVLHAAAPDLTVEASTIDAFERQTGANPAALRTATVLATPTTPIFITFNQPIDMMRTTVTIVDEIGAALATAPSMMLIGASTLKLTPAQGTLLTGQEYNLAVHVVALDTEQVATVDLASPFFIAPATDQVLTATATKGDRGPPLGDVGSLVKLTFNMPVGPGPTSPFSSFSGFNCVVFFAADLAPAGASDSEIGFPTCSNSGYFLEMREPDPTGPAGRSGYSRYWDLNVPTDAQLAGQPRGFNILFSRVNDTRAVVTFPDGTAVPDLAGPRANTLNIP